MTLARQVQVPVEVPVERRVEVPCYVQEPWHERERFARERHAAYPRSYASSYAHAYHEDPYYRERVARERFERLHQERLHLMEASGWPADRPWAMPEAVRRSYARSPGSGRPRQWGSAAPDECSVQ